MKTWHVVSFIAMLVGVLVLILLSVGNASAWSSNGSTINYNYTYVYSGTGLSYPPWEVCTQMSLQGSPSRINISLAFYNNANIGQIRIRDANKNLLEEINITGSIANVLTSNIYLSNTEYGICARDYRTGTGTASGYEYFASGFSYPAQYGIHHCYDIQGSIATSLGDCPSFTISDYSYNLITSETLSFGGSSNITRYLAIPQNTILTNAFMNISGFVLNNVPSSGLKGYYTCNNIADDSLYKNNLTWTGSQTYQPGIILQAFNLTGSKYLTSQNNAGTDISGANPRTLAMWVKSYAYDAPSSNGFHLISWGTCSSGQAFGVYINHGQYEYLGCGGDFALGASSMNNQWTFLTLVYNGTYLKSYVNGILTHDNALSLNTGNHQIAVGTRFDTPGTDDAVNTSIDEIGIWNRSLTDAEISTLYNSGAGVSYTTTFQNTVANLTVGSDIVALNVSANGTIAVNITTPNLYNSINDYLLTCPVVNNYCNVPFVFTSTLPGTLGYFGLIFNNNAFAEISQTFSNQTNVGKVETFTLNMTYDSNAYSAVGILDYNGKNYTGINIGTSNNLLFTTTLTIPKINGGSQNNTFYWIIALTNSSGTFYFKSISYNQTVNNLFIDNCSVYTDKVLISNLFDEDARTTLTGTIETIVNVYDTNYQNIVASFNNSATGNSSSVCFKTGILNSTNYTMSYQVKYYTTSYSSEYVNAQNISLTNATIPYTVNLYDLASANEQDCQITYRDSYLLPQANVILSLQRQYVPINSFLQVEAPITDSNGQVILHFAKTNPIYNVVATQNGQVLSTQTNVQLSTVSSTCQIALNAITSNVNLGNYNSNFNINGNFILTNSSIEFIFTSLDGTPVTTSWNVILNNGYGNTTICTNSQTTASGALTCTIPTVYTNSSLLAIVYVNGNHYTTQGFTLGPDSSAIFGGMRVLLMMMMFVTITLLFISSPIGIVIGSILGMAFGGLLLAVDGLSLLSIGSILIWFIIAGSIIIWRLSKTIG